MDINAQIVLGVLSFLTPAIIAYYRYIWGAKPHVSLSRQASVDDTEWRDVVSDDVPVWSKRCMIRATNRGWGEGVLADVSLTEAVISGSTGRAVIEDVEDSVHKIVLEQYESNGELTRVDFNHRTDFSGQIIPGRSDVLLGILPFIVRDSELGEAMSSGQRVLLTFNILIEGKDGVVETKSVEVSTPVENSAGGELQREDPS